MTTTAAVPAPALAFSLVAMATGMVATGVAVAAGHAPELPILSWVVCAPILGLLLVVRADAVRMGYLLIAIGTAGAVAALGAAMRPASCRLLRDDD